MTDKNYDYVVNSHPRPQLLMEAGAGDYSGETADQPGDGCADDEGWCGTENRECNTESTLREEMMCVCLVSVSVVSV